MKNKENAVSARVDKNRTNTFIDAHLIFPFCLTFFDRTRAPETYAMQDLERGGAIEYNEYNSLQIQINSEPINP